MPRDIRNTKLQSEFFDTVKDFQNPTQEMFTELFAARKSKPAKYRTDDIIEIGPEQHKWAAPHSVTTTGIYLINKFIIEPLDVGYFNVVFTNKVWGKLEQKVADALKDKLITQEQVCEFIDRTQYLFGGPLAHIIGPSLSPTIMTLPPKATQLQKKLMAENKEKIDSNDPEIASKIAEEVVSEALKDMDDSDPAMDFFKSGAIDPYNNYRTMFVMKGPVSDPTGESPTGFKTVKSNYNDGLAKDDIPNIANALTNSAYSSGVSTQDSGAYAKRLNAVFQNIKLGPPGSDCGSKEYRRVVVTDRHLYRYISDGGKLVMITPENISKYKGKMVNMRSPMHCKMKEPEYCSVCVGDRLYRIGLTNIGLTFNIMSGATMNASLKKKHDSTLHYHKATVGELLKYVK